MGGPEQLGVGPDPRAGKWRPALGGSVPLIVAGLTWLGACFTSCSAVAAAAVLTHAPQAPAGAGSMGFAGTAVGWGLLDYKTEKYVMTRNWRVGALQRLLQLGVVVYVVG